MKKFEIPPFYQSGFISQIKNIRKEQDGRKRDFTPTRLDFGPIVIHLARHFGFCYGVENAIEISYRTIEENSGKKIYLLSQMIHNPQVNEELQSKGLEFIMDTEGKQLISWDNIHSEDIVIIPAFGTTLEIEKILKDKNISTEKYNTTCPFVERVWNKAEKLGKENYSIIIHGKHQHEETRATFSHSQKEAPGLVIRDMNEAILLGKIISGDLPEKDFYTLFDGKFTPNFEVSKDLKSIGVVNQTTMLATETQAIADYLKNIMLLKYGEENLKNHFADTRDTLCYATNDNQQATLGLLEINADLALVIGGYNSSNTSHLVELLEHKFPTYFINGPEKFNENKIEHFNYPHKKNEVTEAFLPIKNPLNIIITSGASCPDSIVEKTILQLISYFPDSNSPVKVLQNLDKTV
jgi:4-hydroxy-3-methylbut-2-enyl diphosphate reductase